MFKKERIKMLIGGLLLSLAAISSACSSGTATAQTPRVKPAASSPTPEYKPPKRVSRDIIKTETKAEAITEAKTVKTKAK